MKVKTANVMKCDAKRYTEEGTDDHLAKPMLKADLEAKIDK